MTSTTSISSPTTSGVEEYLEAIYKLTGGDSSRLATTSALAETMAVSAPSVSEMLRRLADQGLVAYRPYSGVSLTAAGLSQAMRIVRYHRLWERFLVDRLGLEWDEVHAEACLLEHATSPRVAQRLAEFLDFPRTCPHGHVVPDQVSDALAAAEDGVPLAGVQVGFRGVVVSVAETNELLQYCARSGLVPGAGLTVVDVGPVEPLIVLEVWKDARRVTVGPKAAAAVRVRSGDQGEEPSR